MDNHEAGHAEPIPIPLSQDDIETEPAVSLPFQIAPFWRRAIGAVTDFLVLAGTSIMLMPVFWFIAYPVGARWGRLIGLLLGVLYLGIFNSESTKGRTLGKWITGTRTVGINGRPLPVQRALMRGLILSVILIPDALYLPSIDTIWWFLSAGGVLALFYGYLLNRQTRQGPHDWLTGSYVVMATQPAESVPPVRRSIHRTLPSILMAGAVLASIGAISLLGVVLSAGESINGDYRSFSPSDREQIVQLVQDVEAQPYYMDAGIKPQHVTFANTTSGPVSYDILALRAVSKVRCKLSESAPCMERAEDLARTLYDQYPDVSNLDFVHGVVVNRIDLGWFQWHTDTRYGINLTDD